MRPHAIATSAALLLGLTACGGTPSHDEIVSACVKAIEQRAEGDKDKPEACEPLSKDDYTALVTAHVIDELGWTDEDGNFDKNKMLEDSLDDQP